MHEGRAWQVAVVAIGAASVGGFFVGTGGGEYVPFRPGAPAASGSAARAPSYAELRDLRRGPNAEMYRGAFAKLRAAVPTRGPGERYTAKAHAEAIAARAERRAFDGAPPVVPHAIVQDGAHDCLVCHEHGARIDELTAPMMSHAKYDSCTQCHVEQGGEVRPGRVRIVANTFQGSFAETPRSVPWAGAPPTVPHATLMRSNCASCHGPTGNAGLQCSHAERQSCEQCHVPDAALERGPLARWLGGR